MRIFYGLLVTSCLSAMPQGSLPIENGRIELTQMQTHAEWDSFSIATHETLTIQMPSAEATMVNRVVGPSASEIHGKLFSNGQVWLLNPNGIFIGKDALIETASFFAESFGVLSHQGTIRCSGTIQLLAKEVIVDGDVVGQKVYFCPMPELQIEASDLKVEHPYAHAIRMNGTIDAREVTIRGDTIVVDGKIDVSSLDSEDAGQVIIFGERFTRFTGNILARGGPHGGNGGFVEVSAPHLDFRGTADRRAPMGKAGMLLLDPTNITISSDPDSNISGTTTIIPTATPSVLNVTTLTTALDGGDVTIDTTGVTADAENGGITVTNGFTSSATSSLTFLALGPILISDNISLDGPSDGSDTFIFSTTGTGTASNYSGITMTANVITANGGITMTGVSRGSASNLSGIQLASGTVQVPDNRTITLTGTAVGAAGVAIQNNTGITLSGGTIVVGSSTGGTCILTGTGGQGSSVLHQGVIVAGTTITLNGASTLHFKDCRGGGGTLWEILTTAMGCASQLQSVQLPALLYLRILTEVEAIQAVTITVFLSMTLLLQRRVLPQLEQLPEAIP